MPVEEKKVNVASKENVKKAMELFKNVKKSTKRRKSKKEDEELNTSSQSHHVIITNKQKKSTALAFLPSFALVEMRSCLMRNDWVKLQRLFPLLLELTNDRATLIWRYALTILLHSPMSSAAHLEEFLNSCVGCQNDNLNHVIKELITLRKTDNKKKKIN